MIKQARRGRKKGKDARNDKNKTQTKNKSAAGRAEIFIRFSNHVLRQKLHVVKNFFQLPPTVNDNGALESFVSRRGDSLSYFL